MPKRERKASLFSEKCPWRLVNGFIADCPVLLLDFSVTGGMGSNQEPGGHRVDYSGSSREKS